MWQVRIKATVRSTLDGETFEFGEKECEAREFARYSEAFDQKHEIKGYTYIVEEV